LLINEDDAIAPWTAEFWIYRASAGECARTHIKTAKILVTHFARCYETERLIARRVLELVKCLHDGLPDPLSSSSSNHGASQADERKTVLNNLQALVIVYEDAVVASTEAAQQLGIALSGALGAMQEVLSTHVLHSEPISMLSDIPGEAEERTRVAHAEHIRQLRIKQQMVEDEALRLMKHNRIPSSSQSSAFDTGDTNIVDDVDSKGLFVREEDIASPAVAVGAADTMDEKRDEEVQGEGDGGKCINAPENSDPMFDTAQYVPDVPDVGNVANLSDGADVAPQNLHNPSIAPMSTRSTLVTLETDTASNSEAVLSEEIAVIEGPSSMNHSMNAVPDYGNALELTVPSDPAVSCQVDPTSGAVGLLLDSSFVASLTDGLSISDCMASPPENMEIETVRCVHEYLQGTVTYVRPRTPPRVAFSAHMPAPPPYITHDVKHTWNEWKAMMIAIQSCVLRDLELLNRWRIEAGLLEEPKSSGKEQEKKLTKEQERALQKKEKAKQRREMKKEKSKQAAREASDADELTEMERSKSKKGKPAKTEKGKLAHRLLLLLREGIGSEVLLSSSGRGVGGGRSKVCISMDTGLVSQHLHRAAGSNILAFIERAETQKKKIATGDQSVPDTVDTAGYFGFVSNEASTATPSGMAFRAGKIPRQQWTHIAIVCAKQPRSKMTVFKVIKNLA